MNCAQGTKWRIWGKTDPTDVLRRVKSGKLTRGNAPNIDKIHNVDASELTQSLTKQILMN
ncbi:hypothetical protein DXJ58_11455 [Vibrio fluvialis]|nr:hypothetical protein [Vibrio fluvialis]